MKLTDFAPLPEMTIDTIGYGAGTKDFRDRANLLRLIVGKTVENPLRDVVTLLETNLDTVSGEVLGHTARRLMTAGALDVYSTSIQMKKDRPGVMLSVLCQPDLLTPQTARQPSACRSDGGHSIGRYELPDEP